MVGLACTQKYTQLNCIKMNANKYGNFLKEKQQIRNAKKGSKQVVDVHAIQCTSTSLIHVDVQLTTVGMSMLSVCKWYMCISTCTDVLHVYCNK